MRTDLTLTPALSVFADDLKDRVAMGAFLKHIAAAVGLVGAGKYLFERDLIRQTILESLTVLEDGRRIRTLRAA